MSVFKGKRRNLRGMVHPKAKSAKITGKPKPNKILEINLILKPNASQKKLPDLNDHYKIENRESIIIDRERFSEDQGAHKDDVDLIKAFTKEFNLKIVSINKVERVILVKGSVKSIENAFGIKISVFKNRGKSYLFYVGTISVPEEIVNAVELITGINNEPVIADKTYPETLKLKNDKSKGEAVRPEYFEKYYNFPKEFDGEGQCIAILSFGGGYEEDHLKSYFEEIEVKKPKVVCKELRGGKNRSKSPVAFEVYQDIEIAGALAPGAKIVAYFAKRDTMGIIGALKSAVHDPEHKPNIISMSWGMLESELKEDAFNDWEIESLNLVLQEAAALNITIIVSSGDLGSAGIQESTGLDIELPASSPYVLAVGGSEIHKENNILHEDVWKETIQFGKNEVNMSSGGGFSKLYDIPKYQKTALPKKLKVNKNRGIPDVAANASTSPGILLNVNGDKQISFGTSAAAPLWAALIARINQGLQSEKLSHTGFINPFLYHNELSSAFNQVLEGSNGEYEAGPGWNPCTGLGTPNGAVIFELIKKVKRKGRNQKQGKN